MLLSFEKFWEKSIIQGDAKMLGKNPDIHGNLHNILLCHYIFPQRIPTLFSLLNYFRHSSSVHFDPLHEQINQFFLDSANEVVLSGSRVVKVVWLIYLLG